MMSSRVCCCIDSWIMGENKISTGCFFTLVKIQTSGQEIELRELAGMALSFMFMGSFIAYVLA